MKKVSHSMAETKLKDKLRLIVRQYGYEIVNQTLCEIQTSSSETKITKQDKSSAGNNTARKGGKKRVKPNAIGYVAKMELFSDKKPLVTKLAERFEKKTFLPTFGDYRNFCQIYGINEPVSKSRISAIPRIFRFIASMETKELQKILDEEMFSGPSRLAPIADEIRRRGRVRHRTHPSPVSESHR